MRHRQKIWPKIILTTLLLFIFFYIVFNTSPEKIYALRITSYVLRIPIAKIAFFTLLFWALTMALSLILHSTKKGFILSLGLTIFLFLKMLQATNWLTLLLLIILTAVMLLA